MEKRKDPSTVDIQKVLLDMRRYRMGLIQTPDQLRFSYMAVKEGSQYITGDRSVQVSVQVCGRGLGMGGRAYATAGYRAWHTNTTCTTVNSV